MTDTPTLSVVVPTCGRPDSLRRLLVALAAQRNHPPFEVIVIADGAPAASVCTDPLESWPFPLRLVEQERAGAAAARNAGASHHATGQWLVFFDDDVEPGPGAMAAHARFHEQHPSSVGAGGLAPRPTQRGQLGSALAGWWEVMCDALDDPRHRFTFRDLLTGHCSMPRELFARLGGFDATLLCHEDFEFGYRAIQAGVPIRRVAGADALHHDTSTLEKILRRKWDEGRADVQLVHKHPALLPALPLGRPLAVARWAGGVHRAALRHSAVDRIVPPGLRAAMRAFETMSMRDKWREALERAMDFAYWRGVAMEAGGRSAAERLREAAEPPDTSLLDVDIAGGLEAAEALIDAARPGGVRVLVNGVRIGELPPAPGAEPLRGVHLRPLLLKSMSAAFASACARAGLLPDVLRGCVDPATPSSSTSPPAPAVAKPGRAA